MTTYNYYNTGSDNDLAKRGAATPGDLSTVIVRRGIVNTVPQALTYNADVANVLPVYAGETVLGAWYRVITGDATANAKINAGFGASGVELANNGAVATANTVVSNMTLNYHCASNTNFCLWPNNGVAIDAGVFEVGLLITKAMTESDLPKN